MIKITGKNSLQEQLLITELKNRGFVVESLIRGQKFVVVNEFNVTSDDEPSDTDLKAGTKITIHHSVGDDVFFTVDEEKGVWICCMDDITKNCKKS